MTDTNTQKKESIQSHDTAGPTIARGADTSRSRPGRRIETRHIVLGLTVLVVAYLALVPIGTMFYASLRTSFLSQIPGAWTLRNFSQTLTSAGFGGIVGKSVLYGACSAIVGTVLGFALAWVVSRTNTPGKVIAYATAVFPLTMPGVPNTMAWTLLLAPSNGTLNIALNHLQIGTFNIYSLPGMIFVQCLHLVPLAFLMGVAAFASLDPALESAAQASGAGAALVLRAITIPLIRPALLSAMLLMFVVTTSTFEVPQLIGVPGREYVFASDIYAAMQAFPPQYGSVGVIGVVALALAALGLSASKWAGRNSWGQTITGKGFRPVRADIGRWRWVALAYVVVLFVVSVLLPFLMLLWSSLLEGYRPPSTAALHSLTFTNFRSIVNSPGLVRSIENSVITSIAAGLIVTALSSIVAFLMVKTRTRGRGLLDFVTTVPIAVPGLLVGVGILYWYLAAPLPFHLYGTLYILIIAYVTIGLPFGIRYMTAGIRQIHDELDEAATVSGAKWAMVFRRIYLPLLRPSLFASFVYVVMLAFRETSAAILIYTDKTQVLSVTTYNLWVSGNNSYPLVAALGVIIVVFLMLLLGVTRLVTGRAWFSVVSGSSGRGGGS